ncbi:MAG: redox-sensing transcriptional repressor Rex [Oscillospiraceae bacterium]|nr:redox-sensing transcriptional repressor Rex [Oscillospiraceae bacterium]
MTQNQNEASKKISPAVKNRLPRYYRYLSDLLRNEKCKISSEELSKLMAVTASQIRQDLNCFGGFGQQGYGYNIEQLHDEIGRILGVKRGFSAVVAGAGNLGTTLSKSGIFTKRGVALMALFDINPKVIGRKIAGLSVMDIKGAAQYCRENEVDIAVLTLPKDETKPVAEMLAEAGVKGFWNFSNMELKIEKPDVKVQNIHMGDSLMMLCQQLNNS